MNIFTRNSKGALGEFIGFILVLLLVFGVILPVVIEVSIYTTQGQELDHLTKEAARKVCSLMADPTGSSIAGDLGQGSLGVGTDISNMPLLVDGIFRSRASHYDSYKAVELKIYDMTGKEIDLNDKITLASGREAVLVGTNTDTGLCPATQTKGAGSRDWKYCMNQSQDADKKIKKAIKEVNRGTDPVDVNEDLAARMEKMQPNACTTGDCSSDYKNRIDHCSVCATKMRESIFSQSMNLMGSFLKLKCDSANPSASNAILPCLMKACASSKYVQYSSKRGYTPKYQQAKYLGDKYQALEDSAKANSSRNFAEKDVQDPNLFDNMGTGTDALPDPYP